LCSVCLLFCSVVGLFPGVAAAQTSVFNLNVEAGAVWQSRNVARIPNTAESSRISLRELQGNGPFDYARIEGTWQLRDRHQLRALYAPLTISGSERPSTPLRFAGKNFVAGESTETHYRFDSYRLSYRYRFHDSGKWNWWGGVTLKVRDANVRLRQGALQGEDPNTGVVPLLSLVGHYRLSERWTLVLDADGLWVPQGRAFDLALKARYAITERLAAGLGYRTLEGGADNDKVYTFAWQHHALAELNWQF